METLRVTQTTHPTGKPGYFEIRSGGGLIYSLLDSGMSKPALDKLIKDLIELKNIENFMK